MPDNKLRPVEHLLAIAKSTQQPGSSSKAYWQTGARTICQTGQSGATARWLPPIQVSLGKGELPITIKKIR